MKSFTRGLQELATLQAKLGKPPKRKEIPRLVDWLVVESDVKGRKHERYFRLLAICALKNLEPRFRNWKPVRRKK